MCMLLVLVLALLAQTPQPFPKVGAPKPATSATPPAPAAPPVSQTVLPPARPAPGPNDIPTEESLGVPLYPGAQFVGSFDAGRGQRYFLFGSNSGFLEIVNLQERPQAEGRALVYEEPAIHSFDIGSTRKRRWRFRRASR